VSNDTYNTGFGGGAFLQAGGLLTNCVFTTNRASYGGAVAFNEAARHATARWEPTGRSPGGGFYFVRAERPAFAACPATPVWRMAVAFIWIPGAYCWIAM